MNEPTTQERIDRNFRIINRNLKICIFNVSLATAFATLALILRVIRLIKTGQ